MSANFHFTKRERNGVVGLFVLLLSIFIVQQLRSYNDSVSIDRAIVEMEQSESFQIQVKHIEKEHLSKKSTPFVEKQLELKPFRMNVNTSNVNDWKRMGLSSSLSSRILKFNKACGGLKKVEDLLKVYGFTQGMYNQIKDSLYIPIITYDLQLSSAEELEQLKGVGTVLSKRIVKYRDLLGGFSNKDQLGEVYGMDSILVQCLKPSVYISPNSIKKINVELNGYNELNAHPYISRDQALSIITQRSMNGNLDSLDLIKIFGPKDWLKTRSYLAWKN